MVTHDGPSVIVWLVFSDKGGGNCVGVIVVVVVPAAVFKVGTVAVVVPEDKSRALLGFGW